MINNKTKKIIVSCFIILFIFATAIAFLINYFSNKSNYTIIDNFDDYYYNVPSETKNLIFLELNNIIQKNNSNDIPNNGAIIRDSEPHLYVINYSGYFGEFIVDVPSIEQSYLVDFQFSEDSDIIFEHNGVSIYCISDEEMVYSDFDCKDY